MVIVGTSTEVINGRLLGANPPTDVSDGNDQLVSRDKLLGEKEPAIVVSDGNERLVTATRLLGLKRPVTDVKVGISTEFIKGSTPGEKPPTVVSDGNDQLLRNGRLVGVREPASVVNDGNEILVSELRVLRVMDPVLVVEPNTLLVVLINDGKESDVRSGQVVMLIEPAVVSAGNARVVMAGRVMEIAVFMRCRAGNEIDDKRGSEVVIVSAVADFNEGSEIEASDAKVDRTRPEPPMTSSAGMETLESRGNVDNDIPCELYLSAANEILVKAGIAEGVKAEFSIVVRASAVILVTLRRRSGIREPSRYCSEGKDNEVIDGRVSRSIPPTTLVRLGALSVDSAVHSLIRMPYVVTDLASIVRDVAPLAAPPSV